MSDKICAYPTFCERDLCNCPTVAPEPEDMGVRIGRLADALTKEQLAELLAIQWFGLPPLKHPFVPIKSAISSLNKLDEPLASLIANGIVWWQVKNKSTGYARITELGLYVIHCRVRRDLRAAGALPPEPEPEEY